MKIQDSKRARGYLVFEITRAVLGENIFGDWDLNLDKAEANFGNFKLRSRTDLQTITKICHFKSSFLVRLPGLFLSYFPFHSVFVILLSL